MQPHRQNSVTALLEELVVVLQQLGWSLGQPDCLLLEVLQH